MPSREVIGVDGCRGGWVAADPAGNTLVVARFAELLPTFPRACFLVDIPMGLPAGRARNLEGSVRALLPGKGSSVFPVPCLDAVYASSYEEACRINQGVTGRKISLQAWNICGKIREVDELITRNPALTGRLFESHPELVFARLAGRTLVSAKRTAEGRTERLAVLEQHLPGAGASFEAAFGTYPRKTVAADDIVDALALAVAGRLEWEMIEDSHGPDERGLPVRLAVPARIC